jgi:hypothetical protein
MKHLIKIYNGFEIRLSLSHPELYSNEDIQRLLDIINIYILNISFCKNNLVFFDIFYINKQNEKSYFQISVYDGEFYSNFTVHDDFISMRRPWDIINPNQFEIDIENKLQENVYWLI